MWPISMKRNDRRQLMLADVSVHGMQDRTAKVLSSPHPSAEGNDYDCISSRLTLKLLHLHRSGGLGVRRLQGRR